MFKGILFDLDGVITDTAEFHYHTQKKLGGGVGILLNRLFNEQLKDVSREDSLTLLLAHGRKEEQFSKTEFLELAKRKNDYYLEMIQSITSKDVFLGTLELLRGLRASNIRISLTSASKNDPFLLTKMGLEGHFDAIADPAKVAGGKPKLDIFLLVMKGIGLTPHDRTGVEDLKAGIAAIITGDVQFTGVRRSEDLGGNIPIIPDTALLTFDYLKKTWQPNA